MSRLGRCVVICCIGLVLAGLAGKGLAGRAGAALAGTPIPATPALATCSGPTDRGTPIAEASPDAATPIARQSVPVDQETLVAALVGRGIRVETQETIEQPFFQAEQVTRLVVAGGPLSGPTELQVYEYGDPAARATDASQITPDGNLTTVMIEWVAAPHFFCAERLIVLYLGDDQPALDLLTELLGSQFAGR